MDLDKLTASLPEDVKALPAIQGLVILVHTLLEQLQVTKEQLQVTKEQLQVTKEQLQTTQEQLSKANDKIQSLEDELKRLRKTPKRPQFRPNDMEPRNRTKKGSLGSTSSPGNTSSKQRTALEVKVSVENVPPNSRFKGYKNFVVQEVELVAQEITYKLEVWEAPDGSILRAQLPPQLNGKHFGPTLKALAANLYAHGMTQPGIHEFFTGIGFDISTGTVNSILLDEAEAYAAASEEILTAGLQEAPFIRVDDTGAKHQTTTGYCTHIGGQFFAYYKTAFSKSRRNFLDILLQGKQGYQINDAAIWHLFQCRVEDDILNLFEGYKGKAYRTTKGLNRLSNKFGLTAKKFRKQLHEAGLVGYISQFILRPGQVLLSDRAGQFALFTHAACWVHMERPLRKIVCSSEQVEQELGEVRGVIWETYEALKIASLSQEGKEKVHELYDFLVKMKSISPEINSVIANFKAYREELLRPLNCPGLPAHNNDSERDIRPVAKRRNISGATKSQEGIKFRDGLQTLKQTCFRLGCNFWDFLQKWHRGDPPSLAELVRFQYQASRA